MGLGLIDRPRRRKILHDKDYYVLKMDVAEGDGDFASARKNHISTCRNVSVITMHVIVDMFLDLTFGFRISDIEHIVLKDGSVRHFNLKVKP